MPRTFQYQKLAEPPVIVEAAEPEAAPPLDWLVPSGMPAAWGQPRDPGYLGLSFEQPAAAETPFGWFAQQPNQPRKRQRLAGLYAKPAQTYATWTPADYDDEAGTDPASGGTFTPASFELSLEESPPDSESYVYSNSTPGTYWIHWTNNAGLANPDPVQVTITDPFGWLIQRAERPRPPKTRQPGLFAIDPTTPVVAAPEAGDATGLMDWLTASVMPAAFGQPRDSGAFAWHTDTPADVGGGTNRRRRLLIAS
jgi:hypothetical protein